MKDGARLHGSRTSKSCCGRYYAVATETELRHAEAVAIAAYMVHWVRPSALAFNQGLQIQRLCLHGPSSHRGSDSRSGQRLTNHSRGDVCRLSSGCQERLGMPGPLITSYHGSEPTKRAWCISRVLEWIRKFPLNPHENPLSANPLIRSFATGTELSPMRNDQTTEFNCSFFEV